MKKICYFGSFLADYSRNKILIQGLKENNCEIIFCQDSSYGVSHYLKLVKYFIKIHKKCDVILVGTIGLYDIPLAWILGKVFGKKVIFDAFISFYDTYVFDRKVIKKNSFKAVKTYLWEYVACHLADLVYLDTKKHAEYFVKTYNLRSSKVKFVYVGADSQIFKPLISKKISKKIIVNFYGSFQPLQGVDYIVRAAGMFKGRRDVLFQVIGDGQTKSKVISLAKRKSIHNIQFIGWKKIGELVRLAQKADISLGIFGKTSKANRVIPNKAYEAIAMGNPLITMKSDAIEELFTDMRDVILVDNNDPQELVDAINLLISNPKLREKIASSGLQLFEEKLKAKILAKKLLNLINES